MWWLFLLVGFSSRVFFFVFYLGGFFLGWLFSSAVFLLWVALNLLISANVVLLHTCHEPREGNIRKGKVSVQQDELQRRKVPFQWRTPFCEPPKGKI